MHGHHNTSHHHHHHPTDRLTLSIFPLLPVIYDILDKLEAKVKEILSPTPDGEYAGSAVVKQVFEIGKVGKVAGCMVQDGVIKKGGAVRVLRGSEIVFKGPLKTLRNVKTDVQEMSAGQECGMSFSGFEDMRADDVVECYVVDKAKKKEEK